MPRILIAIGSNVAAPHGAVALGWRAVCTQLGLRDPCCSAPFENAPAEGASGGPFVNAVGVGRCELAPDAVLATLHRIEAAFGRDRAREGFHGARPLDLDLLDWGGQVLDDPRLQLPHPRLGQRLFVLQPLAQVAPDFIDARSGRSIADLLAACGAVPAIGERGPT